jgi:hypothetical protein
MRQVSQFGEKVCYDGKTGGHAHDNRHGNPQADQVTRKADDNWP